MDDPRLPRRIEPTPMRQVLSWIWALSPGWSFGFATAPSMIAAAVRVRHPVQMALTGLYVVATVVLLVTAESPDGSAANAAFSIALAMNMFVGTGNGIALRRRMFFGSDVQPDMTAVPLGGGPTRRALERQQAALADLGDTIELRRRARELVDERPNDAIELRVGRIDLPDRAFPDGGLIDVNNVPVALVAAEIPALAPHVDQLETARGHVREFSSVDELIVTVNLPPHILDHTQDRLVFLPRYES